MRLPTHIDRYPAKMVSRLAGRLIQRYAANARRVLDPFCGSGAILVAAQSNGIPVSGIDVNPMAKLFCSVKLQGFDPAGTRRLVEEWSDAAKKAKQLLPVRWEGKDYWFTPATIRKFERLRFASKAFQLHSTNEGMAALLSYVLAVRLCSRADQRSPKPFISKRARESRGGRHFDPYGTLLSLVEELSPLYGSRPPRSEWQFVLGDAREPSTLERLPKHSHVITSPPYINAQDYFRNFKLELHLLEGLLPFGLGDLRERFIGTERGNLLHGLEPGMLRENLQLLPELKVLEHRKTRLAAVVHRYLHDMRRVFDAVKACLDPGGCFVLVCGDNLVGGLRIRTWRVLQLLLEERGFRLFHRFADPIADRLLAPKRQGHKGIIKQDFVSAFRLSSRR